MPVMPLSHQKSQFTGKMQIGVPSVNDRYIQEDYIICYYLMQSTCGQKMQLLLKSCCHIQYMKVVKFKSWNFRVLWYVENYLICLSRWFAQFRFITEWRFARNLFLPEMSICFFYQFIVITQNWASQNQLYEISFSLRRKVANLWKISYF